MVKIKMDVENEVTFHEGCEMYLLDCKDGCIFEDSHLEISKNIDNIVF